jgi:hypothetical protein
MSDFSTEKRQWGDIFNMLKEKNRKKIKIGNQESYIWQNCPYKVKRK